MWPIYVNPKDGTLTEDVHFTLGGMSGSLYEYFPKQLALLVGLEPVYQKLYVESMTTATKAIFFRPLTPSNLDTSISGDVLADNNGQNYTTVPTGQHLGCFTGGMLGLGGKLFKNDNHVEMAKKLTDGYIWAYQAMEKGVMPEIAHFVPCTTDDCTWNENLYLNAVLESSQSKGSVSVKDVIVRGAFAARFHKHR